MQGCCGTKIEGFWSFDFWRGLKHGRFLIPRAFVACKEFFTRTGHRESQGGQGIEGDDVWH